MLTIPTLRRTGTAGVERVRTEASDPEPTPVRTPLPRRVASGALWVVVIALVVLLWPSWLGGATRLTMVGGHSMEHTYELGDLLIVRQGGSHRAGDIIVFRVPDGPGKGMLVVHRMIGRDADGHIVTQGDNRDEPDEWPLTDADVVGRPVLRVPYAGRVVMALRTPWSIAVLSGLAVVILLWPRSRDEEAAEDDAGTADAERHLQDTIDDLTTRAATRRIDALLDELLDETTRAASATDDADATRELPRVDGLGCVVPVEITADLMAEAEAWLDAQLRDLAASA